jgi:hypothetical protein
VSDGALRAPASARSQNDLPHRTAARALDAGQQFHPPCPAAAAVMAHSVEDGTDRRVALRGVRLVDHPVSAAAVAGDALNHEGNAANGSSRASAPVGSLSSP